MIFIPYIYYKYHNNDIYNGKDKLISVIRMMTYMKFVTIGTFIRMCNWQDWQTLSLAQDLSLRSVLCH